MKEINKPTKEDIIKIVNKILSLKKIKDLPSELT